MKNSKTMLLIIVAFIPNIVIAQPNKILGNMDLKLDKINTVKITTIVSNPEQNYQVNVSLDLNDANNVKCYQQKEDCDIYFNGKTEYTYFHNFHETRVDTSTHVKENVYNFSLNGSFSYYFYKYNNLLLDTTFSSIQLKDTILNNVNCYQLLFISKTSFIEFGRLSKINVFNKKMLGINKMSNVKSDSIIPSKYILCINKETYLPVCLTISSAPVFSGCSYYYDNIDINQGFTEGVNKIINHYKNYDIYYNSWDHAHEIVKKIVGKPAPVWKLKSLNGEMISLSEYNGKPLLIDFWGLGCGPCNLIEKDLEQIALLYKNKGLNVIKIESSNEKISEDKIRAYVNRFNLKETLINGSEVGKMYNIRAYPTIILIDKAGNIVTTQIGLFIKEDKKKFIEAIEQVL
jgi:thiol-disulfide isomerase/thioredoxin/outer membrane lipoprotein-sorting protein